MRKLTAALAAVLALGLSAAPAFAAESADDFQLYVLGNLNLNGNNFGHRVAVGGNATFTSTSIGGATAQMPASLVVGGDLTYKNGGSIAGQALVGGANKALPYMPVLAGQTSLPVNFTAENLRLKNLSATLAQLDANGTAELKYGGLKLTGLDTGLNVFNISSTLLSQASYFNANIAAGSQVLINVTGSSASLSGGLNFYQSPNILWNFSQATQLTAGGVSLSGTILAPNAAFTGNSGSLAGDLIVGSFNGAISLTGNGYGGSLLRPALEAPPALQQQVGNLVGVPEPGAWTMMILGFGAIGALLRRQRALARA